MFTMLVHSRDEEERELLYDICKEITAHISNEKVNIKKPSDDGFFCHISLRVFATAFFQSSMR